MTTNSLNNPIKLTRSAKINAAKRKLSNDNLLALAVVTGKKADRANAADAAMGIIAKLLTGQAAGGNREEAVLVLRACMGLEGACFDNAFSHFSGSLVDVASLGIWAKPHQAALSLLTHREEAARNLGVWIDAQARFEREGKALRKAAAAANADKVAAKARAFLDTAAPYIERAQARIEEIAAREVARAGRDFTLFKGEEMVYTVRADTLKEAIAEVARICPPFAGMGERDGHGFMLYNGDEHTLIG